MTRTYLTISGGGQNGTDKSYILNDKISFYVTDIKKKYNVNPGVLYRYMGDGEYTQDQLLEMDPQKFLMVVIRDSGIAGLCSHMLKDLHESLVKSFVVLVQRWIRKHPDQAAQLDFKELPLDSQDFTPNYTQALKRLKLMRFKGYDNIVKNIKGYCPFEPSERIRQLLTFPIELFAENLPDLTKIMKKVTPPESIKWDYTRVPDNPPRELYNRIMATVPVLKLWEKYYESLCNRLKCTIDELHSLVPPSEFNDIYS